MQQPENNTGIKVGDIIKLNKFCFVNKAGGTGLSDWQWNEQFSGVAEVKVTKMWYDYETGWKGWAEPINSELKEYLQRNAKQEEDVKQHDLWDEDEYKFKPETIRIPANTIFWSQFDVKVF